MVFPDHADPLSFYYISLRPRLTWKEQKPQLQLIKYKGKEESGGLLTFTVDLRVELSELDVIQEQLQQQLTLSRYPTLSPAPLLEGSVKLAILDKEYGLHRPALYGDNQAIFSVWLTARDTSLLEQALLTGQASPIGVIYTLDYMALRPAYTFNIRAQWDRVQRHIEERFNIGLIFFAVDIERVVDELIENRLIQIELDTFIPVEELSQSQLDDRNRMIKDVQNMVLNTFFEPRLNLAQPTLKESNSSLGFSYRKVDITRIDQKVLNLTVNEQTTVRRSLYPQANLEKLLEATQDRHHSFIQLIDLDLPFYRKRKLQVISRANFEEDGIQSISVKLRYGGQSQAVLLTSSEDRQTIEPWYSILDENGDIYRDVSVQYRVAFQSVDSAERPLTLESAITTTPFDFVEISPRELYSIIPISILTLRTFPWDRYKSIRVKARYLDDNHNIRLNPTFFLTPDNYAQIWNMFVQDRTHQTFQYQVTYNAAGANTDVHQPWREGTEQIIIKDPFPLQRTLTITSLMSWEDVSDVYVDLAYQALTNQMPKKQSFHFSEIDHTDKVFIANLRNPKQQLISYSVIFMKKQSGAIHKIPMSATLDKRLFLHNEMTGQQLVLLSAKAIDFENSKISEIEIEIRHKDVSKSSETTKETIKTYKFDSSDDYAYFKFPYTDEQHLVYRYQLTYRFKDGFQGITDWQNETTNVLNLIPRSIDSFNSPPQSAEKNLLQVEISTQDIDWQQVKSAKVQLLYEDKESDIKSKEKFLFREGDDPSVVWQVKCQDPTLKIYQWKVSFDMKKRAIGRRRKVYYPGPTYKSWAETSQSLIRLKDFMGTEAQ